MTQRTSDFAADSFVAASGNSLHLLRRQPPSDGGGGGSAPLQFGEVLVTHGAQLTDVRWNRNNKVVAAGATDGTIQLLYSSGQVMCVLPRDGTPPAAYGPITSLSWSTGSKRLAAGSGNGSVYIHDMQSKTMSVLGGYLGGVTAVEYQHEDRFLAVASDSGSVVLYGRPHEPTAASSAIPLPPSAADASPRLCLALAAGGDAAVAAGSARGGVAVWDAPTRRMTEDYAGQHNGQRVNALSFVPLRPGWLYSAGGDGRVCLQDRNSGPGHVSSFSVGAPATALTVREDHTLLGVGTADGVVRLYDPRHTRQPLTSLRFPSGQPVTGLHWQHRFATLSTRHRSSSSAAAFAVAPKSSTLAPADAAAAASMLASRSMLQPASAAAVAASVGSRIPSAAGAASVGLLHGAQPPAAASAGSADQQAASGSAPGSRATSPAGQAGPAAAAPPQSRSGSAQAAASGRSAAAVAQPKPLSRPPAVTPAASAAGQGSAPALAITPLTGMAPRFGGASAAGGAATLSHDLPASHQRPGLAAHGSTDMAQQLQQLSITPLTRHAGSGASSHAVSLAAPAGAGPLVGAAAPASPLDLLPAAPQALDVTPLMPGPVARPATAAAAEARGQATAAGVLTDLPAAGPLNVSPLSSSNSPAGGGRRGSSAELCISPLPGMRSAAAGPAQQRSPLGERSTNSSGRGGSFASSLAAAQPHMQPALAPPLPQPGDEEPAAALNGSPSFAENLPLPLSSPAAPTPGCSKQQHERSGGGGVQEPGLAGVHKIKAAPAGAVVATPPAALAPAASGSLQQWSIGAVPSVEAQPQQGVEAMAAAASPLVPTLPAAAGAAATAATATPAGCGTPSSAEFSFAAAQRSAEELSASGAAWAGAVAGLCEAGPAAAAAGAREPLAAPDVGPSSEAAALRDNLLAMHLDMLTQFQAQQECMGQLVGQVLEQNQALSDEVAALRRQLATLTSRRDEFLWL